MAARSQLIQQRLPMASKRPFGTNTRFQVNGYKSTSVANIFGLVNCQDSHQDLHIFLS